MVTVSFKLQTEKDKQNVNDTINNITDLYNEIDNKGIALLKLCSLYKEGFKQPDRDYSSEILLTLKQINCKYLRYESEIEGFVCNEDFFKKKKGIVIGANPDLIIQRCNDCRQGKQDLLEQKKDEELRKKSIMKLLNLTKAISQFAHNGFEVDIMLCTAPLKKEGSIQCSYNGEHMNCILKENELMNIEKVCKQTINPKTLTQPCQYLISLQHAPRFDLNNIVVENESINDVSEALIKSYTPEPENKLLESDTKIVDAEYKTIEQEGEKENENNLLDEIQALIIPNIEKYWSEDKDDIDIDVIEIELIRKHKTRLSKRNLYKLKEKIKQEHPELFNILKTKEDENKGGD